MSPSSPPRSSDNHDDNDNHDDTKDIHFVGSEHAPTSTSSSTNSSPSESNFTPVQRPGFIDAMISEDPVFPDAPVHADEDRRTVRRPSPSMDGKLKLSTTSGLYDRERKGYLDATEQAMRRMDSQNRGFLDNEKVYKIMESLQTEQKKSAQLIESLQREHQKTMSLKRGILYMALFAVLLALSNIGTGFAASRLAKDIIVTGGSTDLVTKNGKTRVATTMKNVVLEFNPILAPTDPTSRRLHERMLQNATTMACGSETMANVNGTNLSTITCEAVGHITYADAVQLYQQFCPEYPFAAGVTSPDGLCSNWGLAEVLLKCGSRFTRVLGGNYFPTAGVPAMDGSVSSLEGMHAELLVCFIAGLLQQQPNHDSHTCFVGTAPTVFCLSHSYRIQCHRYQQNVLCRSTVARSAFACLFVDGQPPSHYV